MQYPVREVAFGQCRGCNLQVCSFSCSDIFEALATWGQRDRSQHRYDTDMLILILGLVLFLGVHSARIVAEGSRQRFIEQRGANAWKGLYSIASLLGLILIVIGYGRAPEVYLWVPPGVLRPIAWLLIAVAFVLVVAAYVPGNHLKERIGHPMVVGVKVWAFAHLLVNGTLAALVLFGAFLIWAVVDFIASRKRDRREGVEYAAGTTGATLISVGIGLVGWVVFGMWLHKALFGVSPFG